MKHKFNSLASIIAGLAVVITVMGNINNIVQFFQTIVTFSDKLSISKRNFIIIIIAAILSIVVAIIIFVILKVRKQRNQKKPMLDFLDRINSIKNENSDYSYIQPFLSQSIENMMATTSTGAKMYNAEIMAAENIDSRPYEITLAQKISHTDDVEGCLKIYNILHKVTDSWTVFLNKDKKIISYWAFVALKNNKYNEINSGKINEKDIELQDLKFIDVSGQYKGYLLISGTSGNCKTQKVRKDLYDSWIKHLEKLSEDNIFFDEISSVVSSEWGISALENIGMQYSAEYEFGGKIYKYELKNIDSIEYLNKFYPKLAEKYQKEYGGVKNEIQTNK